MHAPARAAGGPASQGLPEIVRLREQARRELGDAFDIRAFHDVVLGNGAVTLPMLRAKVERWIAETKSGA